MQALLCNAVQPEEFVRRGLLSLCIRCLACRNPGIRQLAYKAVELFRTLLSKDKSSFR